MDRTRLRQKAIDHAMASIADGSGSLLPFTMGLDGSNPDPRFHQVRLVRHVGESLEESLAMAQVSIDPELPGMSDVLMYALAWDGYTTVDERRWEWAIFAGGCSIRRSLIGPGSPGKDRLSWSFG